MEQLTLRQVDRANSETQARPRPMRMHEDAPVRWFARRFPCFADPAVYRAQINADDVLAYVNDRKEQEFLVLPERLRPVRLAVAVKESVVQT